MWDSKQMWVKKRLLGQQAGWQDGKGLHWQLQQRTFFQPSVPRGQDNWGELRIRGQTKPASAFETGSQDLPLARPSSQITPRKAQVGGWTQIVDPGSPGPEGAPEETLHPKRGLGSFAQGHLQMGLGINPPCLPLARPEARVPLGAVQDARRRCLQWLSDDRWRAGGDGRGGGRCAAAGLAALWIDRSPPAAGDGLATPGTMTKFSETPGAGPRASWVSGPLSCGGPAPHPSLSPQSIPPPDLSPSCVRGQSHWVGPSGWAERLSWGLTSAPALAAHLHYSAPALCFMLLLKQWEPEAGKEGRWPPGSLPVCPLRPEALLSPGRHFCDSSVFRGVTRTWTFWGHWQLGKSLVNRDGTQLGLLCCWRANGSQVTGVWGSECDFEMGVCALRAFKSDLPSLPTPSHRHGLQ